ncbi:MAG: class I SAM-dependent methyltransferase [Candidatus Woesearchaeota archaeon]
MSNLDYGNPIVIERLINSHINAVCPACIDYNNLQEKYFKENINDSKVLVAGSGLGFETAILSEYNKYVLGIDNNPLLVKMSQAYFQKPNIRFSLGDFTNLALDTSSYDHAILNYGTIGNFNIFEQKNIIQELSRVAKVVHIDFYTREGNLNRKAMYDQEGWRRVRITDGAFTSEEGGYSQIFSKREFDNLVKSSGNFRAKYSKLPKFGYYAKICKRK